MEGRALYCISLLAQIFFFVQDLLLTLLFLFWSFTWRPRGGVVGDG